MERALREELARRPLVVVEDHLHHVLELLEAVAAEDPALLASLAVVCLDRPGPDTTAAASRWARDHAPVRVSAAVADPAPEGVEPLAPEVFTDLSALARSVAASLRAGGSLFQDVHLETLEFVAPDRWWESIYVASSVRGLYPERPPRCRFLSNKRNYQATFGQQLLDAGFDPRDVFAKDEMASFVVSLLRREHDAAFPGQLRVRDPRGAWAAPVGPAEWSRLAGGLDLLLLPERDGRVALRGRALANPPVELDSLSYEAATWRDLLQRTLADPPRGLPVAELGRRVGPPRAQPAEQTNAASRHAYALRRRLTDSEGLVNVDREYRVSDRLSIGLIEETAP